jgi:hypothetical protein
LRPHELVSAVTGAVSGHAIVLSGLTSLVSALTNSSGNRRFEEAERLKVQVASASGLV